MAEAKILDLRSFIPASEFSWRYLEQGPEVWRVEIGGTKPSKTAAP